MGESKGAVKVAILGNGNVAAFFKRVYPDAVIVNSHTLEGLPVDASLYILAVSDDAIAEVAEKMPIVAGMVIHTSGTVSIDVLGKHTVRGVAWPFQTLSRERTIDIDQVPLFVESTDIAKLRDLIPFPVHEATQSDRKSMHLAAVFANNFVNHLWSLAQNMLLSHGIEPDLLQPIMQETLRKAMKISPQKAQTGPAVREDATTMAEHLKQLSPRLQAIYTAVSDSIIANK